MKQVKNLSAKADREQSITNTKAREVYPTRLGTKPAGYWMEWKNAEKELKKAIKLPTLSHQTIHQMDF